MGDDRPSRYVDADGTVVYRASSLGMCDGVVLGLARGRMPAVKPEWFQQVLDEGTAMESAIIEMANNEYALPFGIPGFDPFAEQHTVELEIGEINDRRVIVRGHTDGWGEGDGLILEAKKFRPSTWPKFLRSGVECMPHYPLQTSVYWHAMAALDIEPELWFVGGAYDPETESITEVHRFVHTMPPVPLKEIRKRIARWENMIEEGLDLVDLDACSHRMFPCPMFGKGCPEQDREPDFYEFPPEHVDTAAELIKQLEAAQRIKRTGEAMAKGQEDVIKRTSEGLRALFKHMEMPVPKKIRLGQFEITHTHREVPEHTRKASVQDYFTAKTREDSTP
jgi:hypothetical protein